MGIANFNGKGIWMVFWYCLLAFLISCNNTKTDVPRKEVSQKVTPRLSMMPMGDSPKIGSDSASVKMIVFVDYECPFTEKFVKQQLPLLRRRYVEKGLLQINFRNYPLPSHANAVTLAHAATILYEENRFEEFLTSVWDGKGAGDSTKRKDKLRVPEVSEAMQERIQDEIGESKLYANIAGITGTPTFIINDRILTGANRRDDLLTLITYNLEGTVPQDRKAGTCQ